MAKKIKIHTEYIKLGQLLKVIGEIGNGSEAKVYLEELDVVVNGEIEKRRGRKIYPNYIIAIKDEKYIIESELND